MANAILAYRQRALRVGAGTFVSGFSPANVLDTRLDRIWVSVSTGSQYLDATTSDQIFGERAQSLFISANLRTIDIHPSGAWALCAVSTQLEIRAFNQTTGIIGESAVATQAQPSGQAWLAAKFSPDGNYLLATCESNSSGATLRLYNFNSTTGAIGGAISLSSAPSSSPPSGLRGLAWASNSKAFGAGSATFFHSYALNPSTGATANLVAVQPGGAGQDVNAVAFHPTMPSSGTGYVAVGHSASAFVSVYPMRLDGDAAVSSLRAKVSPSSNPGAAVTALKFSPTGERLFCLTNTPTATVYPFTMTSTAFGSPWTAPSVGVSATRNDVIWAPGGGFAILGGGGVDTPEVYQVGASSFTSKVTSFWDSPAVYQNSQAISPNGNWYVSIASAGTAHVTALNEEQASAQAVDVVALINTNLSRTAQIRVRAGDKRDMSASVIFDSSTVDAFDQTVITSEVFTLVKDQFGINYYLVLASSVTADFWRIDITDPDNDDPAFRCSYMLLSKAIDRTKQISIGANPSIDDGGAEIQRTDGDADVVRVRGGRRTMNATIEYVPSSTAFSEYFPLVLKGMPQLTLFIPDPDDELMTFMAGFLGRPSRPLTMPWVTGLHNNVPFELVEAR